MERMIGTPKSKGKFVTSYEFTDELVDVYYSSGPPCGRALTNQWRVQSDVVVSVRILPKKETNFDDVVKDATKFKKTTDPIEITLAYYSNEDEGVRYTVRKDARTLVQDIIAIDYFPDHSQFYLKRTITKRGQAFDSAILRVVRNAISSGCKEFRIFSQGSLYQSSIG